jgi:hypothetical protein
MSLRCFLVNKFIGIHMEQLKLGHALVVITIVTTNGTLLVKVDVGVGNPLIDLALGNLEPSLAAWLELQQVLFRESFLFCFHETAVPPSHDHGCGSAFSMHSACIQASTSIPNLSSLTVASLCDGLEGLFVHHPDQHHPSSQ